MKKLEQPMTWQEAIALYWRAKQHLRSAKAIKFTLKPIADHFKDQTLHNTTQMDVKGYIIKRRATINPKTGVTLGVGTINHEIKHIRAIFQHVREMVRIREIPRIKLPTDEFGNFINPGHAVKKEPFPVDRTILTPEQLNAYLKHCDDDLFKASITAFDCHLRHQDLFNLTPDHANFALNTIEIQRQSKTGKPLSVPMTDRVRLIMEEAKRLKKKRVFSKVNFQRRFKKAKLAADLPLKWTFRTLRPSGATYLAGHNVNMFSIMRRLGHVDIRTTQTYVKLPPKEDQEAVKPLNGLIFRVVK